MFSYVFQSQTGVYRVGILNLTFDISLPARGRDAFPFSPESVIPATDWTPLDAYIHCCAEGSLEF